MIQANTQNVGEAVCSRNTFQTLEERPQVREIVRHVREHRPFEKEFVNEVSLPSNHGPFCPSSHDIICLPSCSLVALTDCFQVAGAATGIFAHGQVFYTCLT